MDKIDELKEPRLIIENIFNGAFSGLLLDKLDFIGVVIIIMDKSVATPFPAGVIYRKSKLYLDMKVNIDFVKWSHSSTKGKCILILNGILDSVKGESGSKLSRIVFENVVNCVEFTKLKISES